MPKESVPHEFPKVRIRVERAKHNPAAVGRPMEAILSIQQRPAHGRGAIETLLADVSKAPETLRVMADETGKPVHEAVAENLANAGTGGTP